MYFVNQSKTSYKQEAIKRMFIYSSKMGETLFLFFRGRKYFFMALVGS